MKLVVFHVLGMVQKTETPAITSDLNYRDNRVEYGLKHIKAEK